MRVAPRFRRSALIASDGRKEKPPQRCKFGDSCAGGSETLDGSVCSVRHNRLDGLAMRVGGLIGYIFVIARKFWLRPARSV